MVKPFGRPIASPSRRNIRAQRLWKVPIATSRADSPIISCRRSRISAAALFVKVTARIFHGATPSCWISQAMRWVMTRVFPEPAPASTRSGPAVVVTARRCASFSGARMRSSTALSASPESGARAGVERSAGDGSPVGSRGRLTRVFYRPPPSAHEKRRGPSAPPRVLFTRCEVGTRSPSPRRGCGHLGLQTPSSLGCR